MDRLSRDELLKMDTETQLTYFENKINFEIDNIIMLEGYNPEKIGTKAYYIFRMAYRNVFKPLPCDTVPNNQASIIDYENDDLIIGIVDIFKIVCTKYNILPLADLFTALTGIARDTLNQWENRDGASRKRSTVRKTIIETASQNTRQKLYSQTVGVIALANNDIETGLTYTRQKLIDGVAVQAISTQALPKLSLNNNND